MNIRRKAPIVLAVVIMISPVTKSYAEKVNQANSDIGLELLIDTEGEDVTETNSNIPNDVKDLLNRPLKGLNTDTLNSILKELDSAVSIIEKIDDVEKKQEYLSLLEKKKSEVNNLLDENTEKAIYEEKSKISEASIKKEVKIFNDRESLYVSLPEDSKLNMKYKVFNSETNVLIDSGIVNKSKVELPKVSEKTKYKVEIEVYSKINNELIKEISINNLEFNDTERPRIESIYIEDGEVFVQFYDNYILDGRALGYKLDKDKDYHYIRDNSFKIGSSERVSIVVRDLFGNETTESFKVKNNNDVIKGDVSDRIKDRLDRANIETVKGFNNLIIVERGKDVDLYKEFESYIDKNFSSKKRGKLKIDGDVRIKDDFTFKTNKVGMHEFVFYTDRDDELTIYVYVNDKKEDIRIRDIKKNKSNVETAKKDINLMDYIDIDWYRSVKNKKTDNIFVRVEEDNKITPIKENLQLKENEVNYIDVLDLESKSTYNIKITHKEDKIIATKPSTNFVKYFHDVDENFWAAEQITKITNTGLIHGYPDRTYRPQNNITVREFLTIYGRFIGIVSDSDRRPATNKVDVKITGNQWGKKEIENVYSRIQISKLNSFNKANMDRAITREEVAFIIGNTLNVSNPGTNNSFEDIGNSVYRQEINALYRDGKLKGYPDNTFKPSQNVTRAEIASFVSNLF